MAQIKQQANIGSLKHDQIEVLEKEKKKKKGGFHLGMAIVIQLLVS